MDKEYIEQVEKQRLLEIKEGLEIEKMVDSQGWKLVNQALLELINMNINALQKENDLLNIGRAQGSLTAINSIINFVKAKIEDKKIAESDSEIIKEI